MRILEIKVNNPLSYTVEEVISTNLEIFYKLSTVGVKNISTAIDYFMILETFRKYAWIDNFKERKEVTASQCKVTLKTVENALSLMNERIEIKPAR